MLYILTAILTPVGLAGKGFSKQELVNIPEYLLVNAAHTILKAHRSIEGDARVIMSLFVLGTVETRP